MTLVRYDPWSTFQRTHRDFSRLFDDMGFPRTFDDDGSSVVTSGWTPAVDIREEEDSFVLTADIPGVDPKDIEITMDKGVLTIKGERTSECSEERAGYRRVERCCGTFYRRFSLPDTADAEHISAKGDKGVVEITIPKLAAVQPRRIPVDV